MTLQVTQADILHRAGQLPAFPRVVTDILATLDDENSTIGSLAQHVGRDPVITARILSQANSATAHARSGGAVRDVATATSMIGIAKLREIVLTTSLAEFNRNSRVSTYFWEHSVAVGVCAQEVAKLGTVSGDYALVAGLLHDIGQLWMAKFYPLEFQQVRMAVSAGIANVNDVERHYFGLDHCEIGRVIAEYWRLPESVVAAIVFHHEPDTGLGDPLVGVVHVAEVLSNALDLTRREGNQVYTLSAAACAALGLDWSQDMSELLGRIEARSEYACAVFR